MAEKNPHAVALGRAGGKKGGLARAAALSPERRSEIAQQGGIARWQKKCQHKFYYPGSIASCRYCNMEFKRSELFTVPCKRCGAKSGHPCLMPSGYRSAYPHIVRETDFVNHLKGDGS